MTILEVDEGLLRSLGRQSLSQVAPGTTREGSETDKARVPGLRISVLVSHYC